MPDHFKSAEKSSVPTPIWNAIKEQMNKRKGIYLFGDAGSGKTHTMFALFNRADASQDYGVWRFWSVPDFLSDIKSSFDDKTDGDPMKLAKEAHVLILDDIGAEKATEWSTGILFELIDYRYRENKITLYSSNIDLDKMSEVLGDRITSRIRGSTRAIRLFGKDRRVIC